MSGVGSVSTASSVQQAVKQLRSAPPPEPRASTSQANRIIDVGDLPDGIIDVGDLPNGIIDVGDLPDGVSHSSFNRLA